MISRSEWGAVSPTRQPTRMSRVDAIVFHWGGVTVPDYTPAQAYARVRGIQRYHMVNRGWSDIGYNFCVDKHGQVFEGRGWGIVNGANGDAVANRTMVAVCYVDGPGMPFTDAAKAAIRSEILDKHPEVVRYLTHNDVRTIGPTACPGPDITAWVRSGCPSPLPPPKPPQEDLTPMFDPPLQLEPIVAEAACPTGGVWLLAESGAVYSFGGAPYRGGMNPGNPYAAHFEGRRAVRLEPCGHPRGGPGYVIVANTNERYGPDFGV